VLILDEPTSGLAAAEVEALFSVVSKLREKGLAILFITHFLDQMYKIADRVTVLRNGVFEGEYLASALPQAELVAKMLGKELNEFSGRQGAGPASAADKPTILAARGLGRKGAMAPVDLDLKSGDVVGLAGLLGSGRTETARMLFGIDPADEGEILVKGKKTKMTTPRHAIRAGMGFCSEDRKSEGVFGELTVRENILLALQARAGAFSYLPLKKQHELADGFIKSLGIKTPTGETEIRRLSGGNQQKVLLARWLATKPELLILDEPTRGIDVGAKLEIMELILNLSRRGMALLLISSEFEEVVRCSDRIAVLRDRVKVTELVGDDRSEAHIMRAIAGGTH